MQETPAVFSVVARTSTAADRLLRDQKQLEHVKQLWIFLASILACLTCIRASRTLINLLSQNFFKSTSTSEEKYRTGLDLSKSSRDKYSLFHLPAALATAFRIGVYRSSIPVGPGAIASISELAFILLYIAAMFIWLLIDTRGLETMFYEDRAAHLASSQLPLIVALAGKNNIISFLTGISHERLNVLHRAAGRTNLLLLWLHAISRTVTGLPQQVDFSHIWMRLGAVGLTSFSIATILSLRPVRHIAFEFFLMSHIILICVFLICGYFHAREQDYGAYIWPALLLWALDRVMRLVRILCNNRVWSSKSSLSCATVELLTEDTIRLTFRRRVTWRPGQHAYITLSTISGFPTEAHPFSIANLPETGGKNLENEVVFLIRSRAGFTKRLRDYAIRNNNTTVPALLDGPYGCPPDLRVYSTCVLIAGGSGVSYTLPLLMHLVRTNINGQRSAVRRIVFLWAVRDAGHLTWISSILAEVLSSTTRSLTLEPRVYITGPQYSIPTVASTESDRRLSISSSTAGLGKEGPKPPEYSPLKLVHGRPSISKLLHDEILSSMGPVSVDVAGPASLTESIRRALRTDVASPRAALGGLPPVTLHVETFGMVKK